MELWELLDVFQRWIFLGVFGYLSEMAQRCIFTWVSLDIFERSSILFISPQIPPESAGIREFRRILQELTGIPEFRRNPSESIGIRRNLPSIQYQT